MNEHKTVPRWFWRAFEELWARMFAVIRTFQHARSRSALAMNLSSLYGGRVLIIAPHPDDECTGCGGVIGLHLGAGHHVTVIQITDGRASRAQGLDAETMARVRLREGHAAAQLLGVSGLEQWGLREGEWNSDELVARLRDALLRVQPDILYAPSCVDFHPEHVRVARALAAALDDAAPTVLRVYAISVPLTSLLANCVADTSTVRPLQDAALAAYRTQTEALRTIKRLRRYLAHSYGAAASAEEFWELTPRSYQHMMQQGDWLGDRAWARALTPFRSLQFRSWSDPLAFWYGRHERQQLEHRVHEIQIQNEFKSI